MGQAPSGDTYNIVGDGLPLLQGCAEFGDVFPIPKRYCSRPTKRAAAGSVLVSVRAPVGEINQADQEYCIGRGIAAIEAGPSTDAGYLPFLMATLSKHFSMRSTGSTFEGINRATIASASVLLPALDEQSRIVAVLGQADRAVEAAARHVADANRLFAAARGQAATIARDADRRSEICHFAKVTKGSSPTMRTGSGTYPFVVTAEEPRTAPQWQIEGPAVCVPLISSTGHGHASIKRLHLAHDKFALANLLAAIHQINGSVMIPSFLYHLLTHLKDELLVPLMSGTANVTMSVSSLERLVVPIPPLAEQQAIVARIEKVEAAVRAAETHLERLRALRSSLLENLVSGRVRLPMPDATASGASA